MCDEQCCVGESVTYWSRQDALWRTDVWRGAPGTNSVWPSAFGDLMGEGLTVTKTYVTFRFVTKRIGTYFPCCMLHTYSLFHFFRGPIQHRFRGTQSVPLYWISVHQLLNNGHWGLQKLQTASPQCQFTAAGIYRHHHFTITTTPPIPTTTTTPPLPHGMTKVIMQSQAHYNSLCQIPCALWIW